MRDVRSRFNVISACGRSWSHSVIGKLGAVVYGGAAAGLGTSRFHSLVINDRVPMRTMQSLYFTMRVLALNNAVHP